MLSFVCKINFDKKGRNWREIVLAFTPMSGDKIDSVTTVALISLI